MVIKGYYEAYILKQNHGNTRSRIDVAAEQTQRRADMAFQDLRTEDGEGRSIRQKMDV